LTTFWFLERSQNYRKKKRDLMNQVAAPKVSEKPQIDPITLEVIRHGIISICDQIDANMTRRHSARIYEYKDYAVGFVGRRRTARQSTGGMPVFVADSVGMAVRTV